VVIPVNASQNGEVPKGLRIGKQVNVAGCPGGFDTIWGGGLKIARIDVRATQLKYGAFSTARWGFVGHLRQCESRKLNLSTLLLAVPLIVTADALKIVNRESKHRLTRPFDQLRLTKQPGVSSDGEQFAP